MANEHIGRLQAIGVGIESTAGSLVPASIWARRMSGSIKPVFESIINESAQGVIDDNSGVETVKNISEIDLSGIMGDNIIGYFLKVVLGTYSSVQMITLPTPAGGTPARGDAVYVGVVSSETYIGVLKKIVIIGATTYYFVTTTSGTLGDGDTMTDGTWTATVGLTAQAAVKGHFFERLNTNNHPTMSIYGSDPIGDKVAKYSMVNTFELESTIRDWVKYTLGFMGKQLVAASAQTPAYISENEFTSKAATVKFGDAEADLNGASTTALKRFKLTINKNLNTEDGQALGSDDVESLFNQNFNISGDLEALYSDEVLLDYVADSTKKACRLAFVNADATAIITGVYPSLYVDMAQLGFNEWDRSEDLNGITTQTVGFQGIFKNADAMSVEMLLLNTNAVGY